MQISHHELINNIIVLKGEVISREDRGSSAQFLQFRHSTF